MTPNAVRHQLARLEAEGLVGRRGTVRGTRRPSQLYGLTGPGVDALSRAYLPALLELLSVLDDRLPPAALRRIMTETGERLSAAAQDSYTYRYGLIHLGARDRRDLKRKLAKAKKLLGFRLKPVK